MSTVRALCTLNNLDECKQAYNKILTNYYITFLILPLLLHSN